jgi:dienelactone hydrolase
MLVLRGVLLLLLGVAALRWPGATLAVLVLWIGAGFLVNGAFALAAALAGRDVEGRVWMVLEGLLGIGDPQLKALAEARVGFFELDTGHWPMLACPGALTDVLLRAAAGEGHRLSAASDARAADPPRFLLAPPECRRARTARADLYLPEADGPRPAVVFVHGGPVPEGARPTPREWPVFTGYGRLAASRGLVGVTLDHRLHALTDFTRAAGDVADAVSLVREDPRVDPERVALWFFSGGGLLSADWLAAPPRWLRCLALTYPILAPLPNWPSPDTRFHPAAAVGGAGGLPVVLTRVGHEAPPVAGTVEEFLGAAATAGARVEVIDLPDSGHAFETTDRSPRARAGVDRALDAVLERLRE